MFGSPAAHLRDAPETCPCYTLHNAGVINYWLKWSGHVKGDLDAVWDADEQDGLFIEEVFELLETSELVRAALAAGDFRRIDNPRFDAAPVRSALREGLNVYYLKMWRADGALLPFRLLYGVHHGHPTPMICVLGLMPREDDYEQTSDFGRRVRDDYDHFCIARIPRA